MTPAEARVRVRQGLWKLTDRVRHQFARRSEPLQVHQGTSPIPGLARPSEVARYLKRYHPEQAEYLTRTADDVRRGEIEILGHGVLSFDDEPHWREEPLARKASGLRHWSLVPYLDYEAVGDSKVTWELNRTQFLVPLGQAYQLTGDPRYADRVWEYVDSWIRGNPEGRGINWASSLEVSLRAISWCWAWHLADGRERLDASARSCFLSMLQLHGRHIAKYLSTHFAPNTHLTGEALGLCYLASMWPGSKYSDRWWRLGSEIFRVAAGAQIRPDGLHFERSACYHIYTLEFYLHYALLCRSRASELPESITAAIRRMVEVAHVLQRPDGLIPNFGDDDGGKLLFFGSEKPRDPSTALAVAAALLDAPRWWPRAGTAAPAVWVLGVDAYEAVQQNSADNDDPSCPRQSCIFPSSGFIVSHLGEGDYALASAGAQEPLPSCLGHVHDDALAVEMWADGAPVLVDPGTYTYTGDSVLRSWYRSADAHIGEIDHPKTPSVSAPFHWNRLEGGSIAFFQNGNDHHFVELSREHRRGEQLILHRRRIVSWSATGWLIWDRFYGEGHHALRIRHQLAVEDVERHDAGWTITLPTVLFAAVAGAQAGEPELVSSPISPRYGCLQPAVAWVIPVSGRLPVDVLTVVLKRHASKTELRLFDLEEQGGGAPAGLSRSVGISELGSNSRHAIRLTEGLFNNGWATRPAKTAWLLTHELAEGNSRLLTDAVGVEAYTTNTSDALRGSR